MDENNGFNGSQDQNGDPAQNQFNQNPQFTPVDQTNQYSTNYDPNGTQNNGTQFNTNYNPNASQTNNQQYVSTPGADDGKNWSIAALICGIAGIVLSYVPVVQYIVTIAAILGIVFGVKGRKLSTFAYGKPSPLATAGLILGIIGTAFAALGIACSIACGAALCSGASALNY